MTQIGFDSIVYYVDDEQVVETYSTTDYNSLMEFMDCMDRAYATEIEEE